MPNPLTAPSAPHVEEVEIPAEEPAADAPVLGFTPEPEPDQSQVETRRPHAYPLPPEPWYYEFADKVFALLMILGGLIATGCLLMGIQLQSKGEPMGVAMGIAASLAALFATGVITAPGLIFLDLARNIRAMRYRSG